MHPSAKLTPNFSLAEFIRSDTALTHRLDNSPTPEHLANLRLTALGMEMVRLILGRAILVSSAYRSPVVNAKVGGTPTSAHPMGYAVDFSAPGLTLFEAATQLVGKLPYDQLIFEHHRCVHISFDPRLRMQALTQRGAAGSPIEQGILPTA